MSKKNKELIKSKYPIIETHCHLDSFDDSNFEELIQKSIDIGIEKFVTVAVSPDNQDTVLKIANNHPQIFCTQGVHPHEAKSWDGDCKKLIIENSKNNKVRAIGEVGLDYHYDHSPRNIQQEVFKEQIQLSIDLNLPLVIHTRESEEDTISILKKYLKHLNNPVEIHCFSSNMTLARFAIENDFYMGFNGIITFNAAANVKEVLKIVPLNRILLETDCPYLAPIPFRGKKNFPYYLPFISSEISKILNIPEEDLLKIIYQNSIDFFNF